MKTEPFLLFFFFVNILTSSAQSTKETTDSSNFTLSKTYITVNNITSTFWNNGICDNDEKNFDHTNLNKANEIQYVAGFIYPKGSGKTAVYSSGFMWGTQINSNNTIKVGGSKYESSLQPGRILSNGTADNPSLSKYRIYRVRPDYKTADLSVEKSLENEPVSEIRKQYEKDWNEWPADDGAPFEDVNKNGKYDPNVDIPGVKEAAQTIWYVANDLNQKLNKRFSKSEPTGIELQVTIWAYTSMFYFSDAIKNTIFKQYLLINKSKDTLTNMYVSYWADTDIGNLNDDFVGCDSTLGIGFGYNGKMKDSLYSPLNPPAVGFDIIQGPHLNYVLKPMIELDTNCWKYLFPFDCNTLVRVPGDRFLSATSFYFQVPYYDVYGLPPYEKYIGYYNLMKGKIEFCGCPFTSPITGKTTKFPVSGDPVMRTGWLDGYLHPPGERELGLSSGPFEMQPGDTQKIVIAEIAAGTTEPNVDAMGAVSLLKYYDEQIQNFWDYQLNQEQITGIGNNNKKPNKFKLYQNYPNPFNPTTTIRYSIKPALANGGNFVILRVFDILGREVTKLVDKKQNSGSYEVNFNASNLSSGIYYYRLKVGDFTLTKKMVLAK